MMAEEIRGKRRKQANPRRNQVDIERASSLGSEGEDEVGLWSLEPQDCQESLEKNSLTPSEGTEEPGSPARSGRPHSLSPDGKNHWATGEPEAEAEGEGSVPAPPLTDREEDHGSLRMYGQNSDSQNALEDLAQYDILVQLRKASNPASLLDHPHLPHNGTTTMYHPGSRLDELPPAIWSPGSHHRSPEGHDAHPLSPDALRMQQACPFCHRTYQRGASLREHIKYCQEREGSHMVCPLCGYTATYRAQMERHVALHNQIQDKNSLALDHGTEARKFKCLQCGKAFKYKHHLKEHLRIHSGEKPYECPNCKKRFSHSGSYSSHLSSKKCLSGGGNGGSVSGGGGGSGGIFNGHSQSSYPHHSSPTSPPAGGGRTSNGKGSPFPSQTQDYVRPLGQITEDAHHHISAQENHHNPMVFPRAADLARLWDPMAGVLKGTTLMPYLPSGAKFEQMLQEMLHREVKPEEGRGGGGVGMDEGRVNYNGGGHDGKVSPDRSVKRERAKSSEGDRGVFAVTCRWCSQLFPNTAVLLQHERYLCKMNREAVEMPEVPHGKDHLSPTLFFSRTSLQGTESSKQSGVANGLSEDKSPVQKPNWHSVPQQLLVAMHSPSQHRPEPLPPRPYWSSLESGSPGQPISPSTELSSPQTRRRVPSSGFGSPLCLDLSICPPDFSSPPKRPGPQNRSPWSAGSQNEPLDLSLPKPPTDQEGGSKIVHDKPSRGEKRELEKQHFRKMSPSQSQHLALHQLYSGSAAPVFGGSMYNGFPVFNPMLQASFGGSGHESISSLSLSHPTSSPGFLSPMTYMMETDTDAMLKKIHQERQALMGEVLSHGGLDYLSLMEDGMDGEGVPGRKRLKKTEEGLYACDICEKTFQKSSSLLRHKYEHTGKRPHECKICNKAFKHKHHLIEHSRLHSGEKPYQCDKCGKRFSHSGSYSQHMNHRYAYCSRDQDPDQDPEEPPLTPGTGNDLGGALSLSADDTQTPHLFLSDSSLDGGPGGLREEEEEVEEDKEESPRDDHALSLSEAEDRLGCAESDHVQELPEKQNGDQNTIDNNNIAKYAGTESTEHRLWDEGIDQQNGEPDEYDLSLDTTDSQ